MVTKDRDSKPETGAGISEKPTLKTIAQISGFAVPTVSRALSGASDISERTRARVRQIADEIGYVPNRAGVRLRTGRTNVISLVLATDHDMMNHTAKLITAIAGALRQTPFHLNITPYFPDEDPMKPIRYVVETGSADAVILNQIQPDDPRIAYLVARGFPFAAHGRTKHCDAHAYYDFDNGAFGRVGVQDMVARGRKKLLLVAPPLDQSYAQVMVADSADEARRLGAEISVLERATSDDNSEAIESVLTTQLDANPCLNGVICGSINSAMAAVTALEARNLVLGRDADIFAKEAIPFLKRFRAPVRTLQEDVAQAGDFLARAAMARILTPDADPMQFLEVPHLEDVG